MFEFAHTYNAFPTQKEKETRPEYKNKEEEIVNNELINQLDMKELEKINAKY